MTNIVPVAGADGEWYLYLEEDIPNGNIGHRCKGFPTYMITKAFFIDNMESQIHMTCYKCLACGVEFPDYVIGFARFLQ